jgi:hypothetical protein
MEKEKFNSDDILKSLNVNNYQQTRSNMFVYRLDMFIFCIVVLHLAVFISNMFKD